MWGWLFGLYLKWVEHTSRNTHILLGSWSNGLSAWWWEYGNAVECEFGQWEFCGWCGSRMATVVNKGHFINNETQASRAPSTNSSLNEIIGIRNTKQQGVYCSDIIVASHMWCRIWAINFGRSLASGAEFGSRSKCVFVCVWMRVLDLGIVVLRMTSSRCLVHHMCVVEAFSCLLG